MRAPRSSSRRLLALLASLAVAGAAALAVALGPAASAAMSRPPATCSPVSGDQWKWRVQSGTMYSIGRDRAVPCAFVRHWVPLLSRRTPTGPAHRRVIAGAPDGWTCSANFPVHFPHAWIGNCVNGDNNEGFNWLPLLKRA